MFGEVNTLFYYPPDFLVQVKNKNEDVLGKLGANYFS